MGMVIQELEEYTNKLKEILITTTDKSDNKKKNHKDKHVK